MNDLGNQSVHILVVDRDAQVGNQIRQTVIDEGYSCQFSSDATQAIQALREKMPSLMIVDTDLDGSDGFQFARHVRVELRGQQIPVIFTSEQRHPELVARSRQAGGFYFLGKPIDPSVLLELVSKALWMPHLIRRHIDTNPHNPARKAPRILAESSHRVER